MSKGSVMREKEVTFYSEGSFLSGTLATPHGDGMFPLCLLIQDSYTRDRDGDLVPQNDAWIPASSMIKRQFMRKKAEILASLGIATFRYDKRGCGKSEGSYESTGLAEIIEDAKSALAHMVGRQNPDNGEVDRRWVGVLGHGEGAIAALNLAASEGSIHYCICEAGTTFDLRKFVGDGTRILWSEFLQDQWTSYVKDSRALLYWSPEQLDSILAEFAGSEIVLRNTRGERPIHQYLVPLDQVSDLSPMEFGHKIDIPVLLLHGGQDRTSVSAETREFRTAMVAAKKENFFIHEFWELDHYFAEVPWNGEPNEPDVNHPIDIRVIDAISHWLEHHQPSSTLK